jgi:hypothetical protein
MGENIKAKYTYKGFNLVRNQEGPRHAKTWKKLTPVLKICVDDVISRWIVTAQHNKFGACANSCPNISLAVFAWTFLGRKKKKLVILLGIYVSIDEWYHRYTIYKISSGDA